MPFRLNRLLSCLTLCLLGSHATLSLADEPASSQALTTLPYTPGLDLESMDKSADPCVDFYQYTCGGWLKNNPIPNDQARWGVYSKLADNNKRFLWGILADLAKKGSERSAAQQKIGDYFAACMDQSAIEKRGAEPIQTRLGLIAGMQSKADLPRVLAQLHLISDDDGMFFGFGSRQDFLDATRIIASNTGGGISLPDREYYSKQDDKSRQIRERFLGHIAKLLQLSGLDSNVAKPAAQQILALETALAQASLSRVDKRDPQKLLHHMNQRQLQALTPSFDWPTYLQGMGLVASKGKAALFNVSEPKYLRAFEQQLRQRPLADIQMYLRWHLLRSQAPHLSSPFADEHFAFFSKTLRGVPEQAPRWKRCVNLIDVQLGEALGQEFVQRAFSPELKEKTRHMTAQIATAMGQEIDGLAWMSAATKKNAHAKLKTMVNKVGYPDQWRDYSQFQVKPDDFAGNVARGTTFEVRRQLAKIGKPLDRAEWNMTPPTVNASYEPQINDITFPAGVLQPPLFDAKMDAAPNYGNTGGTIGHEITHGFDDEGRQYDAKGNLRDWWTRKDAKQFNQRAQCIVDQYAGYTVVDDIKINSKLTLGEDVADLGGLLIGWLAWKAEFALHPEPARDGFTPEQRFFIGYAQWACENNRPENQRLNALTNPHSPGKYRVNGVVANLPEFAKAFSCKAGQPMVREKVCRVW